jgi:flagellar biosynthetic protein FliR
MPETVERFIGAAVAELAVGAAFAFGLMCVFGALQFGGRLLDIQIGFGVATLFDPATRAASPLLGTALNLMAVSVFLALDSHHEIVRAVADSLQRVPLGTAGRIDAAVLVGQFGAMLGFGVALVAPPVAALLLLDLAMAVVARTMPQMNIFIVSMPLKVVVGLLVLGLALPRLAPVLQRLFGSLGPYWRGVAG